MALVKCHECNNEVSSEANVCPKCGVKLKTTYNKISAYASIIFVIAIVFYFFGGGLERQTELTMIDIEKKVANDSVIQYEIANRNGTAIDICVHAGFVSAAFLQAKDESNYKKWKELESIDCKTAGMPD